jgi:hypothetical protein
MSIPTSEISIEDLSPLFAKRIIQDVGGSGQPPVYGYQFFTAGIGDFLTTIENEYLADYIHHGGSSFKLVVGSYGGGKTHFLYSIQGLAWNYHYVSSYIELKPDETPLHNLESVYKAIVANLLYPQTPESLLQGYDKGIEAVIKTWYYQKTQSILENHSEEEQQKIIKDILSNIGPFESTSYLNAIKHAFTALYKNDEDSFNLIIQWLKGEKPPASELKKFQINEKLDKSTAFKFIRCLIRWLNEIGYAGLIILMDEAEQTPSMSSKQREKLLNNLRELVDACSKGIIKGSMFFYAVPDESFLEGRTNIYEALNQRLSTLFEGARNPTGVKIHLEKIGEDPEKFLIEIGKKLALIYEKAYDYKFDDASVDQRIESVAKKVLEEKFGQISYKRLFVQEVIKNFHDLKSSPQKGS